MAFTTLALLGLAAAGGAFASKKLAPAPTQADATAPAAPAAPAAAILLRYHAVIAPSP